MLQASVACKSQNETDYSLNPLSDQNQSASTNSGSSTDDNSSSATDDSSTNTPADTNTVATPISQPSKIWIPKPGTSFYWQLQGTVKTNISAEVYDIDLENNETNGVIPTLKAKGKKVICYFSAGTYENWRGDASSFPSSDLGSSLDEWPGERWLDIRSSKVRSVLSKRIDRAVKAGCDAIEPDNLDAYQNKNGKGITAAQQIEFLKWLSDYAHKKGISVGLKNALDIIDQGNLTKLYDWALNEQCYQFGECGILSKFVKANKAVFIAEYNSSSTSHCSDAKKNKFSLSIYTLALDGSKYQTCK